eukprot:15186829-Heterocapsa_arctica.AAC.1
MSRLSAAAKKKLSDNKDSYSSDEPADADPVEAPAPGSPMPLLAEAWSIKRPRGRSKAEQYEKLVKSLDEAMAA